MALISELCAEHRELEALARQLMDIVSKDIPDAASVAAIRWRMMQLVRDHCTREEHLVYDMLMASGDAAATAIAWASRKEHGGLTAAFAANAANWSVGRIAQEWPLFREETRALLDWLARRVAQEEATLYVLAERVIERRAAA